MNAGEPMRRWALVTGLVIALGGIAAPAHAVRVKDLGHFDGVRKNQLIGYGLVVGLDGTGDTDQAGFSAQSLEAMLSRLGVRVEKQQLLLRNVAAVTVTAELPSFAKPGTTIDVQVSSIGNARSLVGGTLLMSPLKGANGETYALAQGPVMVGSEKEHGERYYGPREGLNVGRIINGGMVERDVPVVLGDKGLLRFMLSKPDFKTAANLAAGINGVIGRLTSAGTAVAPVVPPTAPTVVPTTGDAARALDAGTIEITVPAGWTDRIPALIAELEAVDVKPDALAKVVVSGSTVAVVLGGEVRLSQVAIAYDGVSLEIRNFDQPQTPPTDTLKVVDEGATLADVVRGLNRLGVTARGLVDILQALAASGALHADLEVMP